MEHKRRPSYKDGLKKKEIEPGKDANLERGDFLAILIAVGSIILPVLIGVFIIFAIIIIAWNAYFA